jgi:hypothetical protein
VSEHTYVLQIAELSPAAKAELVRRVKAGEVHDVVKAELLIREKKAVVG